MSSRNGDENKAECRDGDPAPPMAKYRRALLLAAPFVFVTLLLLANVVIPAIWQRPRLTEVLLRPCVLHTTTGIPCPFCGATRATVLASRGQWRASLRLHPAGVLLVAGGGLLAAWCAASGIASRDIGLKKTAVAAGRAATPRHLVLLFLLLWFYAAIANIFR